jgi:transposase-like protein
VDLHLSRKRDVNAAKAFLRKAMKRQRIPAKSTFDAYAASHRAVSELKRDGELPKRVLIRSSKYVSEKKWRPRSERVNSASSAI